MNRTMYVERGVYFLEKTWRTWNSYRDFFILEKDQVAFMDFYWNFLKSVLSLTTFKNFIHD